MKSPDTTLLDMEPPKMPLSSFSVGHLPLGMQLPFRVFFFFSSKTPLEKIKFSFVSAYQLEIAFGIGIRVCVQFSFYL